jgi:hypothetical protein
MIDSTSKKSGRAIGLAGLVLAAGLLPMATMAQEATATAEPTAESSSTSNEGWSWTVAPYLWATSISTNLKKEGAPEFGTESEFDDLLSKLDMAFQLHVEGQGDRFGAFADITYIALSDSKDRPVYTADTSLDTKLIEVAGVWNVDPERFEGLDLFAGVRHIQAGTDVELVPVNPLLSTANLKFDQSFTDFMAGARYNATLSERWGLTLRADGGWGDTETDYSVSALLRYKMSKGSMILGYRYMELGVAGDSQDLDLTLQGPVLAFAFGL